MRQIGRQAPSHVGIEIACSDLVPSQEMETLDEASTGSSIYIDSNTTALTGSKLEKTNLLFWLSFHHKLDVD